MLNVFLQARKTGRFHPAGCAAHTGAASTRPKEGAPPFQNDGNTHRLPINLAKGTTNNLFLFSFLPSFLVRRAVSYMFLLGGVRYSTFVKMFLATVRGVGG